MRNVFQTIYHFSLQACGVLALGFGVIFFLGLPGAFLDGRYVLVPALVAVLGIVLAVCCVWPKLRPGWVTRPHAILHGVGMFFMTGPLSLPLIFLPMLAVIIWDVPEPMGKSLAILGGLSITIPAQLVHWLGLLLGCWPDGQGPKARRAPVEEMQPQSPGLSTEDLRALRLSRMQG